MTKFKPRQRVMVRSGDDRVEPAAIIKPQKGDPLWPVWQTVRFDDGAKLVVLPMPSPLSPKGS